MSIAPPIQSETYFRVWTSRYGQTSGDPRSAHYLLKLRFKVPSRPGITPTLDAEPSLQDPPCALGASEFSIAPTGRAAHFRTPARQRSRVLPLSHGSAPQCDAGEDRSTRDGNRLCDHHKKTRARTMVCTV